MLDNIGLMQGIGGKMGWLNQRQTILSQNIANADTPQYRPHDLTEVDFGAVMDNAANRPRLNKATTDAGHISTHPEVGEGDNRKSRTVYESAPAENAVVLEEQLLKSQKTQADYNLITNLYRKNVGMIKMVVAQ